MSSSRSIKTPTEVERWLAFLRGEMGMHEVRVLLGVDLWKLGGCGLGTSAGDMSVIVLDHTAFRWAMETLDNYFSREMIDMYDHAMSIMLMQSES